MVPIADQEQFLKALKTRLDITPEKGDNGTLKVAVPVVNEIYLRFANGYLYVAPKAKDLDPKGLIAPKAFFAKDDGSVAVGRRVPRPHPGRHEDARDRASSNSA